MGFKMEMKVKVQLYSQDSGEHPKPTSKELRRKISDQASTNTSTSTVVS